MINPLRSSRKPTRAAARAEANPSSLIETLESRILLSESAGAQLSLLSTTGSGAGTVYHYSVTVNDTGTTNIGTFWFGWVPGQDFLGSVPTNISNPPGWTSTVTGSGNHVDGSAIEWSTSSNAITPGQSLGGFNFSSTDSPTVLAGNSPDFPGTPAMTATVYSGGAFSDAGFQLVVAPAATTAASRTTLVSSSPSVAAGNSVTITAVVSPASGMGVVPTGSVVFSQDGNSLGSVNLQPDGTAALITSALPVGTDHITATYGGDSNYTSSASSALTQTVTPPPNAVATTTTLLSSSPAAAFGSAVQFTATVAPAIPGATPTGTVTFSQDGNALGTAPVQSDGTATFSTSTLPLGSDSIVATYSGNGAYAVSASGPLAQTITQPPTLLPTITKSKLPTAVVSGTALRGTVTINISNASGALVKGKATLAIYASTTGGIDGSSILLGQVPKSLKVSTAKALAETINIKAASLPAGSYMLFARVTDPTGNVNDSAAGQSLTVAAPFITLSETLSKNTLPTTGITAGGKARGSATLNITNGGNIPTPGTTTLTLFATTDGEVDGSAVQIASLGEKLRLKPGKSARVTLPLKTLPALPAATYTLVLQVLDPSGQPSSLTIGTLTIT
ncbi:MAG: hypothetical protein JWP03_5004 [Phycisphaerales bacterium]|nr:hypothetical protein [Phycisphaerales bacterium]